MTKITLKPVQYYDIADIYEASVDNRPLIDISTNINTINTAISDLGFYQEVYANPDTEPAGGFSPLTCVFLGQNSRIYPIDISQSVVSIDYSKYPIYLVLASLGLSLYKCLAFSASFNFQTLFNKFLPDSVGSAIKVGPGGSLVDEIYFDLYYSDYNYQNIIVGKVLTPTTISFGGNQVSVVGDNRFLSKNRDDSTTGLITRYIQNDVNSTAFKSILVNTDNSGYPFTEYVNYIATPYGIDAERTPIYFTSAPLNVANGAFTTPNVEALLNEIHFAAPSISADTLTDIKYRSAGINVGSLLNFSETYLLHSQKLSANLEELTQSISTSLIFDSSASTTGLTAQFTSLLANFGTTAAGLTSTLVSASNTASGISFGSYSTGSGSILCHVTNNTPSNTVFTEDTNFFDMSSLLTGNALLVYNKGVAGSLILGASGPILLSSSVGAFYSNSPTKGFELANKQYVDMVGLSAANTAATRIPLAGALSDAPVTGGLYFDIKSNTDPNTVLQFDTLLRTDVRSTYPIEFKTLDNSGYQTLRADTPTTGVDNDVINRTFLATALDNLITNAIGSRYVRKDQQDTISAIKTFDTAGQIITQSSNPIVLNKQTGNNFVTIQTNATALCFTGLLGVDTAKLRSAQTVLSDDDATLTTKKFVVDQINLAKPMGSIFSIWGNAAPGPKTYLTGYVGWSYGTRGIYGEQSSTSFPSYFELVEDGALHYRGSETILLTVSLSCTSVQNILAGALSIAVVVRTGSTLKVVGHAVNGSYTETVNSTGHSQQGNTTTYTQTINYPNASYNGLVLLNQDDILYPVVSGCNSLSFSVIKAG